MKKFLFAIIALVFIYSCNDPTHGERAVYKNGVWVDVIDSVATDSLQVDSLNLNQ